MKLNIIKEMYCSQILRERYGLKGLINKKAYREYESIKEQIEAILGEENRSLIYKYDDAYDMLVDDENYFVFEYGFKVGAAYMKKKTERHAGRSLRHNLK